MKKCKTVSMADYERLEILCRKFSSDLSASLDELESLKKELIDAYELNEDLLKLVEERSVVVDVEAALEYIAKHGKKISH